MIKIIRNTRDKGENWVKGKYKRGTEKKDKRVIRRSPRVGSPTYLY